MIVVGERLRQARGVGRLDVKVLVAFLVLAYALSWSRVIPLATAHQVARRGVGWPTHLPIPSARLSLTCVLAHLCSPYDEAFLHPEEAMGQPVRRRAFERGVGERNDRRLIDRVSPVPVYDGGSSAGQHVLDLS